VDQSALKKTDCLKRDASDPLRSFKDRFALPPSGSIHFDANSIGAMPKNAPERVQRLLEEGWRKLSRRGWSELDWLDKSKTMGAGISHILGAHQDDVVVCDNTTINLFKILSYAWRIRKNGSAILTEAHNFPTDIFVAEGFKNLLDGFDVDCDLQFAETREDVHDQLGDDTAVLYLTHTDYRYSQRWDMSELTKKAHEKNTLVIWDLSHSAGALEIDLMGCNADFAVGCGYKYLCGGPGSPAFIFIHPSHQNAAWPTIAGWLGHADFFAFANTFTPNPGVQGHNTGSPSIIANEIFDCAVDIWRDVNIKDVGTKHRSLSETVIQLIEQECSHLGVSVISPKNYFLQGGHIAFEHEGAGALCEALFEHGMICSFRKPNSIRLGISPLYHSHEDMWDGVQRIKQIISSEVWRNPRFQKITI